ncbi:hypothetical protein Tco_0507468 [Tanacetum coccineum]
MGTPTLDSLVAWNATSDEWRPPHLSEPDPSSLVVTDIVGRRQPLVGWRLLSVMATWGHVFPDREGYAGLGRLGEIVGLSEEEKKTFWDSFDDIVREFQMNQRLIIGGGDLNGHIGAAEEGYLGVHGDFGYGFRNEEVRSILDFATAHNLL